MEHTVNRESAGRITVVLQKDPETGEIVNEYYSTRKAANAIGKPSLWSNIAKACREGRICAGYHWEYEKLNQD